MGTVFQATDEKSKGRRVVLKFGKTEVGRAVLARELKIGQRAKHKNVCQYYSLETDPERGDFLVIQHGGSSISDLVEARDIAVGECLNIVKQIAGALDDLHFRPEPVIHSDVSPGNVLVDTHGIARLTDFGVSRTAQGSTGASTLVPDSTRFGGEHQLYSANEVLLYTEPKRASDQYSLALVVGVMLSGRILTHRLQSMTWYGLNAKTTAVLARATAHEPKERFRTCTNFYEALAESIK